MKIQALAIIAIIVLLPILMVLNKYIETQTKTLSNQVEYDNKLQNSTYDALKAFQLNTANSDTSDIANSKIRDVKAGVNTFFNSLANNFSMDGYNKETLSNFVPAVVFTMYDGYYIYSPYTNKLDSTNDVYDDTSKTFSGKSDTNILGDGSQNSYDILDPEDPGTDPLHPNTITYESPYYNGQELSGLKSYVYYSCRYKRNGDFDITITYSLDSYITIQGWSDSKNEKIDISGYLLSDVSSDGRKYRGIDIPEETGYRERLFISDRGFTSDEGITLNNCPCRMINGVRYYHLKYDNGDEIEVNSRPYAVYAMINGKWGQQNLLTKTEADRRKLDDTKVHVGDVDNNTNAIEYYRQAYNLKERIKYYGLDTLETKDAVDAEGNQLKNSDGTAPYFGDSMPIFEGINLNSDGNNITDNAIEETESNFNEHRLAVIKYAIESNLSAAINNFNTYSTSSTKFQMPKLQETEWEFIYNNICILTFMQGLNIGGGRLYSGHSIVPNTDNKEYVSEDSIQVIGEVGEFNNNLYKVTYNPKIKDPTKNSINDIISGDTTKARSKMSFNRASTENLSDGSLKYFYRYPYPIDLGPWFAYDSIVTEEANDNNFNGKSNIYDYVDEIGGNLAKVYYTALGRERGGMYRVENENFVTSHPGLE